MYKELIVKYKDTIIENHNILNNFLEQIGNHSITNEKNLKEIIMSAIWSPTGIYNLYSIENYFLKIAETLQCELNDYQKNTTLHVLTEALNSGGHTRVVERWISSSADEEKHCVLLTTNKSKEIPQELINAVKNKNGEIIELNSKDSSIDRGLYLRKYASNFDKIILHIHPFDYIPIIAFGTNNFSRHIFLYNHADHMCWLGLSIADTILEIRKYGKYLTENKRIQNKSFLLSIPTVYKDYNEKINFPEKITNNLNKKIILSYGSSYKFREFDNINIINYIKLFDDTYFFILIGLNKEENKIFYEFADKFPDRITILDIIPFNHLQEYIKISDLVIDSFPICGGTALLDAINLDKPTLSLKSIVGNFDYTYNTYAQCDTIDELYYKTIQIFSSTEIKNNLLTELKTNKKQYESSNFQKRLKEIYALRNEKHLTNKLYKNNNNDIIPNDFFNIHTSNFSRKKLKLNFKFLKIYSYKVFFYKYYEIKIFKYKFVIKKIILGNKFNAK